MLPLIAPGDIQDPCITILTPFQLFPAMRGLKSVFPSINNKGRSRKQERKLLDDSLFSQYFNAFPNAVNGKS